MKDANHYLIQVSFDARLDSTALVIGKNGRPLPFKELQQREQKIIVELAEGVYKALKAKYNELFK